MYQLKHESRHKLALVVEDEKINQTVAKQLLRKLEFEVHVACNGKQAIESVNTHCYSLILMDCNMPEMDGLSATRIIRRQELATGGRVFIAAFTAGVDSAECFEAGMDAYLPKPLNTEALLRVMDLIESGHCSATN
jgi:CheY-like chemotaxis protein